jgi:hypothetical protein
VGPVVDSGLRHTMLLLDGWIVRPGQTRQLTASHRRNDCENIYTCVGKNTFNRFILVPDSLM